MLQFFKWLPVGLLISLMTIWAALAIYYGDSRTSTLQTVLAVVFTLLGLLVIVSLALEHWRLRAIIGYLVAFIAVLSWWLNISPSNDREWHTDMAILPYADVDGDVITMHNIRNFEYQSEFEYTPAYYDKTVNMNDLTSVDLMAVYWMGPAIAHTFISFGFGDNDFISISIEARKEKGEGYSSIKGAFRQFELFYVVGDERDLVRLRTNYRKNPPEDVYLYRLVKENGSLENAKNFFLEYVRKINSLKEKPEFYNTVTTNCTGNIWLHAQVVPDIIPFSWKVQFSGYLPEYLHENNKLDTRVSFPELQKRSYINPLAHEADQAADFSQRIRANLEK